MEYEAENVSGFDAMTKGYRTSPAFLEKMQGYTELSVTGRQELLQVTLGVGLTVP